MIKDIKVLIGTWDFDCRVDFDYQEGVPEYRIGHPDNWTAAVPEDWAINAFDVLDEDKHYKADYLIDAIEDDIIFGIKEVLKNENES